MKIAAFALVSFSLVATSAHAALITVDFTGSVTGVTPGGPSLPTGAPMVGYFTYDPQASSSLQSADSPILVIDFPTNRYRLEMKSYYMGVRDNWLDINHTVPGDGFGLTFSHPFLQSGGGGLRLDSTDVTLFNSTQLPTNLPPLARFDASRFIGFHYDFQLDYWAVGASIETLVVRPGPGPIPNPRVSLTKAVKPGLSNLVVGLSYQLQVSSNLVTWTDHGTPFTATDVSMVYPQYFDVDVWHSLFFRARVAP